MVVDETTRKLVEAVQDAAARHHVYAHNIANAMTPGYKPLRLPEEKDMVAKKQALGQEDKVEVEAELAKTVENHGKRDSYLRLISMKRGILTQILRQGR